MKNKKGFTLVEILVVLTIVGIVSGSLYMIMSSSWNNMAGSQETAGNLGDLNLMFEYLKNDLKTAVKINKIDGLSDKKQIDLKSVRKLEAGKYLYRNIKYSYDSSLKCLIRESEELDHRGNISNTSRKLIGKGKITEFTPEKKEGFYKIQNGSKYFSIIINTGILSKKINKVKNYKLIVFPRFINMEYKKQTN